MRPFKLLPNGILSLKATSKNSINISWDLSLVIIKTYAVHNFKSFFSKNSWQVLLNQRTSHPREIYTIIKYYYLRSVFTNLLYLKKYSVPQNSNNFTCTSTCCHTIFVKLNCSNTIRLFIRASNTNDNKDIDSYMKVWIKCNQSLKANIDKVPQKKNCTTNWQIIYWIIAKASWRYR